MLSASLNKTFPYFLTKTSIDELTCKTITMVLRRIKNIQFKVIQPFFVFSSLICLKEKKKREINIDTFLSKDDTKSV